MDYSILGPRAGRWSYRLPMCLILCAAPRGSCSSSFPWRIRSLIIGHNQHPHQPADNFILRRPQNIAALRLERQVESAPCPVETAGNYFLLFRNKRLPKLYAPRVCTCCRAAVYMCDSSCTQVGHTDHFGRVAAILANRMLERLQEYWAAMPRSIPCNV